MAFGTLILSTNCPRNEKHCFGLVDLEDEDSITSFAPPAFLGVDLLAVISLLVVGILGATSVIMMSPAAAYSMIGISGALVVYDVASFVQKLIT